MADEQEEYAEKLLKSVNDAANAVSSRFVTFVTVGAYVAVTVAATTHEMLLRANNRVPLPLLNTEIPIVGPFGFYSVAPWLILLLHSDLLLQLSILANELTRFEQQLTSLKKPQQANLRQGMVNFYYVLYLSGGAPSRFLHFLSAFITWITAVALPLALLLWIQIRFLPYHSRFDTWLHASAVLIDVILILFILMPRLWRRIVYDGPVGGMWARLRRATFMPILILVACVVTVSLTLFVAIVPDDHRGLSLFPRNMQLREQVLTANQLDPQDINILRSANDKEELNKALEKVRPLQALQGRDFRFADLESALLPIIDLRAVQPDVARDPALVDACNERRGCQDPSECEVPGLQRAQLSGANLFYASMPRAMLDNAVLEHANLGSARLQDASLDGTHLNRATLGEAKLQDARLRDAKLCGANLKDADLSRANLERAFLQGANLSNATLVKANLSNADLRGADLSEADLTDADFSGARLQGAILHGAKRSGAVIDEASLELTDPSTGTKTTSRDAVTTYLVELACADASAAYGIAAQALGSPHRDGVGLARALLDAHTRPDCAGVAVIPGKTKELLATRAAVKN